MLGKFFSRRPTEPAASPLPDTDSGADKAMEAVLAEKEASDPDIRAKVCAGGLQHWLKTTLRDERGVRVQTLLGVLGSLAGFACQMAIREQARLRGHPAERITLIEITTKDGRRAFFGDPLNALLLEGPKSVWAVTAGGAHSLGVAAAALPDVREIAGHVSKSLGSDAYGIPRLPKGNELPDTPAAIVKAFWPTVQKTLLHYRIGSAQWPLTLSIAIQRTMIEGKDALDPFVAATIVMECAVPAAKLDPRELGIAAPG
jgi:hypothetical protein